jgi:alpha-acetolactate decarboxylase
MRCIETFLVVVFLGAAMHCSNALAQPKRSLMQDAHALVFDHATISRSVEKLPNGVRTITKTANPDLLPVLRKHPRQMGELYQQGGMVRGWDPLFRELAAVSGKVKMEVKDIENGVEVLSTSEDAEVVKLIQAHADKVSDMAKRGAPAMREPTAIPPGYARPGPGNAAAGPPPPQRPEPWDGKLVQFGTMHEAIGAQQSQGRVTLSEVLKQPHFYGVGALEKLAGELTILDGAPTLTRVNAEGVPLPVDSALGEMKATLLVGAYVPQWTEHEIATAISPSDLDKSISEIAAKSGFDVSKPFMFAIDGVFSEARLHVINGACPMHARLKKIELSKNEKPFEADLSEVHGAILGVFAKDAVGRLTHPGTSTHMHLQFKEEKSGATITGHLEQIGLSGGCVLYLPLVK